MAYGDLQFLGTSGVIATVILQGPDGVTIVDPGPSTTLPALRALLASLGMSVADVTALLLTHIHLDHAGASGTLVREQPRLRVFVHEKGAPHLVDPSKLLVSAGRLYGDQMERLWGEVAAVPQHVITPLAGGERLTVAGRLLEVAYTPGHASHHVSYFSRDAGVAFVGDTAGVRLLSSGTVFAPTPPPDIDLELWADSLSLIGAWQPDTLFVTHFGPVSGTTAHLDELRTRLSWAASLAKTSLARDDSDEGREAWFAEQVEVHLRRTTSESDMQAIKLAAPIGLNWRGLARYWRKREAPR